MYVARWALIGAALLAAFQAWLWGQQRSWLAVAGAIALAIALVAVVHLPGTRYSEALGRVWALPRKAGEAERTYRFRIALAWVLVTVVCASSAIALPLALAKASENSVLPVGLFVFGFVAALMGLQSFLVGWLRASGAAPPNTSLERTREG